MPTVSTLRTQRSAARFSLASFHWRESTTSMVWANSLASALRRLPTLADTTAATSGSRA